VGNEEAQTRHPASAPGVSLFIVQGRRDTEARQGFRAAGLHDRLPGGAQQHRENALDLHRKGQIIGIFRLALSPIPQAQGQGPSGSLKMTEFFNESYAALKAALSQTPE
jgi:hypothetical protein